MPQVLKSGKVSIQSNPESYFAFDTLPQTWADNYNKEYQFKLYMDIVSNIDASIGNDPYAFSDDSATAEAMLRDMANKLSGVASKLWEMADQLQSPVSMESDGDFLN